MALTRPKYSQIYDTDWKQSVRVATTADVGNLFAGNTQPNTIDGVSLSLNDRILVKDQTNKKQNGIYIVRDAGTGSNGWWTRTLDALSSDRVTSGLTATASEGTLYGGREFRLVTPDPITLNETDLDFINQTGTPGGANTQVQFADGTILGGNPGFTYNKTSNIVTVANSIVAGRFYGNIAGGSVLANTYISTSLIPAANIAYDLGSPTNRFRSLYLSGNTIDLGETLRVDAFGTWYFTSQGATIQMGASVPFNAPTANISGNILTSGNIIATGNVTGSYFLGNGSQLTGVITSVTKIINGNATVSAYPSGNISVTPGGIANVVVFATQPVGTTANASMHVSGDIQFTGNLYQNGNLFTSGSGTSPFSTVFSSNFGLITGTILTTEDQGNLLSVVNYTYDLGTIPYTQPVSPSIFTLPSYTAATLPTASTPGVVVYNSDTQVLGYSTGSAWANVISVVNGSSSVTANITINGNITAGNVIATHYGNSIGTAATYTGNVSIGNLTVFGSAGGYFANITGVALAPYGGSQTWRFFTQNISGGGPGSWILFPDSSTQTTAYPGSSTSLTLSGNVTAGNLITTGAGIFPGAYNENTTSTGVFVGNTGSGTPTPRVGFFNGNTTQNWQVDNYFGQFRWFTPGVTRMYLDITSGLNVASNVTVTGTAGITMPNRPAFRIYGSGVTANQSTSNVNLKGSVLTVDYNQGSYFNSTTGQFITPVAGLYQIHLVARVGNNNGLNQIAILKNGLNSAGNVMCFWETDTNAGTASHFGTGSVVKLAVGDYLSANILAGQIQFDNNDSWSVTYLG